MYFHNWCWSEDFRETIFIYEMTYELTFVLMFLENISWQKSLPNISVDFQTFLFLRNFPGTTIKYLFAILYIAFACCDEDVVDLLVLLRCQRYQIWSKEEFPFFSLKKEVWQTTSQCWVCQYQMENKRNEDFRASVQLVHTKPENIP